MSSSINRWTRLSRRAAITSWIMFITLAIAFAAPTPQLHPGVLLVGLVILTIVNTTVVLVELIAAGFRALVTAVEDVGAQVADADQVAANALLAGRQLAQEQAEQETGVTRLRHYRHGH